MMCAKMALLQEGLSILLGNQGDGPIEARLDKLRPQGKEPKVPGLGRAPITAILQVTHPDQYGIWNATSEMGMQALAIWPKFDIKDGFGERYRKMNDVPLQLVAPEAGLGLDLWTLDSAWWGVLTKSPDPLPEEALI